MGILYIHFDRMKRHEIGRSQPFQDHILLPGVGNGSKSDILKNKELALLRSFPNVTVSHHMAFYTKNYVETVVKDSLMSCKCSSTSKAPKALNS